MAGHGLPAAWLPRAAATEPFLHRERERSTELALPNPLAHSPQASSIEFPSCWHCQSTACVGSLEHTEFLVQCTWVCSGQICPGRCSSASRSSTSAHCHSGACSTTPRFHCLKQWSPAAFHKGNVAEHRMTLPPRLQPGPASPSAPHPQPSCSQPMSQTLTGAAAPALAVPLHFPGKARLDATTIDPAQHCPALHRGSPTCCSCSL